MEFLFLNNRIDGLGSYILVHWISRVGVWAFFNDWGRRIYHKYTRDGALHSFNKANVIMRRCHSSKKINADEAPTISKSMCLRPAVSKYLEWIIVLGN